MKNMRFHLGVMMLIGAVLISLFSPQGVFTWIGGSIILLLIIVGVWFTTRR